MGYRGKLFEQAEARRLRAAGWTMDDIAARLAVSKSSVSLWTRDVGFEPRPRQRARRRGPNALQRRKAEQIADLHEQAALRLGALDEQSFLAAGAALYAGEGSKTDGSVRFANSNPAIISYFCAWLRACFDVDESRMRCRVYLHEGLDLDAAEQFWSSVTSIPRGQFTKSYRARPDATIRKAKHEQGCAYVIYSDSATHRYIMGLVDALLSSGAPDPG